MLNPTPHKNRAARFRRRLGFIGTNVPLNPGTVACGYAAVSEFALPVSALHVSHDPNFNSIDFLVEFQTTEPGETHDHAILEWSAHHDRVAVFARTQPMHHIDEQMFRDRCDVIADDANVFVMPPGMIPVATPPAILDVTFARTRTEAL